jgi:hypothetical protein
MTQQKRQRFPLQAKIGPKNILFEPIFTPVPKILLENLPPLPESKGKKIKKVEIIIISLQAILTKINTIFL